MVATHLYSGACRFADVLDVGPLTANDGTHGVLGYVQEGDLQFWWWYGRVTPITTHSPSWVEAFLLLENQY